MTDWLAFHMEDAASGSFFRELFPSANLRKNALPPSVLCSSPLSEPLLPFLFPASLLSRLFYFRDLSFSLLHTTASPPTYQVTVSYLPSGMRSYLPGEDISPNLTGHGNFDSCSKISPIICVQASSMRFGQ